MKLCITFLVHAFLIGSTAAALAQSPQDIFDRLKNVAKAAIEWGKLPQSESSCLNEKLHQRGDNIQSFIQRGIPPSDPRIADLRPLCSAQLSAPLVPQAPTPQPTESANTPLDAEITGLKQTIEQIQSENTIAKTRIAELEKIRSEGERALRLAEQEKTRLETTLTRLGSEKEAAEAKAARGEAIAYAVVALTLIGACGFVAFRKKHVSTKRIEPQESILNVELPLMITGIKSKSKNE